MDWTRRHALGALGAASLTPAAFAQGVAIVAPLLEGEYGRVYVEPYIEGARALAMLANENSLTVFDRTFAKTNLLEGNARTRAGVAVRSKAARVRLGPASQRLQAPLVDIAELPTGLGRPCAAVVGRDLLKELRLLIDRDARQVTLMKRSAPFDSPAGMQIFPLGKARPTLPIRIEGVEVEAEVRFSGPAAVSAVQSGMTDGWFADGRAWSTEGGFRQGVAASAMMQNIVTTLKTVQVGPFVLRSVPVSVGAADPVAPESNAPAGANLSIGIGAPLLARFLAMLDDAGGEIGLLPRANLAAPFRKSATGLGVREADGVLVVMHVGEHSPAAEAGFKEGEVINAVNGGPATRAAMLAMKTGESVTFSLADGGTRSLLAREYY